MKHPGDSVKCGADTGQEFELCVALLVLVERVGHAAGADDG